MAPVFGSNVGMVHVYLEVAKAAKVGDLLLPLKKTTSATAQIFFIYGERVLKRRGLRGLLRLAFAIDLRSKCHGCARTVVSALLSLKMLHELLEGNCCF